MNIPDFPLKRCSEAEALDSWDTLVSFDTTPLIKNLPWTSRSDIDPKYVEDFLITKSNLGNSASDFFHWQARIACNSLTAPSPIRAWFDPKLRKNIEGSVYYKDSHKSALTMRGYVPSQFRPSAAKALIDKLGSTIIYDPCGGWGDRLAGAMASSCAEEYFCRDVNPLVFTGYALQKLTYETRATPSFFHKKTEVNFEMVGAEVDCPKEDYFDLVFTSPPYYKIEKYEGKDQSWLKYKGFDQWMDKFLFPMLVKSWKSLKTGGIMALNISDCYADHTKNMICMPAIEFAKNLLPDCEVMGVIGYEIAKRKKDGPNAEPIIMLRKKSENIYPGKQFQVKVSGSLTIQTALEQLLC
jgi:hypothetical protein